MLPDLLIPFMAIALAELGDKTQLAVFCLASRTRRYVSLLLGVCLAFLVSGSVAVLVGDQLSRLLPMQYVRSISGMVFIIVGLFMLLQREEEASERGYLKYPFAGGFALILLSEMGDKSQIATAVFAARFHPLMVFAGVSAALIVLSVAAVLLGSYISELVKQRRLTIAAGIVFVLIGISCFF